MSRPSASTATALKRGWTTGACATAATKAALTALISGDFPDPVHITLPKGQTPAFALAYEKTGTDKAIGCTYAQTAIIKDAGDDPDVTHQAMIFAKVWQRPVRDGRGILFLAGTGVGIVTQPGLPIPVNEASITPVPRQMMTDVITELCQQAGWHLDMSVEISIPNGAELAQQTLNPRLGIMGGLSILGTTGIVHPYSCSAWIHSIHRGVDVANANELAHLCAATGRTSEDFLARHYRPVDAAQIEMGDFAGALLKYLRKNPCQALSIGGGPGKLAKLAQGHLDLHSGRSQVDFDWLMDLARQLGANPDQSDEMRILSTGGAIIQYCHRHHIPLARKITDLAHQACRQILRSDHIALDIKMITRQGQFLAETMSDHPAFLKGDTSI